MRPQWLVLILLLPVGTVGFAKKLYKYQDQQGRWYFSDKAPATERPVEVRQLKPLRERRVWLEKTGSEGNPGFFIINQYPGPIEVAIDWRDYGNLTSTPALPHRFVVEPGKSDSLFSITADAQTAESRFTLEYRYVVGRPLPDYISRIHYLPPLAPGGRFQVSQGFGGEFSHHDLQNQYAVDIMMPIGTPIHAARAGIVLEVEDDFYVGGMQQAFASKANSIWILHDDGSIAVYAHLALEMAQVYPGLQVQAGDLIGYSGNTGFSSGPHLHFAVQVNRGMQLESVPFQFLDAGGRVFEPRQGGWLEGLSCSFEIKCH